MSSEDITPGRPGFCLSCRSVVLDRYDCTHEGADVVDLALPEDRARAAEHMRANPPPRLARVPTTPAFTVGFTLVTAAVVVGGLHERCLGVGDRVALECELVNKGPSLDERDGHAYRDPAASVVTPRGMPIVRVLEARRRSSQ